MIGNLVEALRAEFGDVSLYLNPSAAVQGNSVVVRPGTPFIEPSTHGMVRETWDVLVVVNTAQPDKGVAALRKLSLRVARAAHSVGALWDGAPEVGRFGDDANAKTALSNTVRFRYSPDSILTEDESSS